MSFGFSVGDFIAVAHLATDVYQRCSAAGSNFASLSQKVDILRETLEVTKQHIDDETPNIPDQLRSLSGARRMCEDTLRDVDELLTKCESLGTKSKRFIDRMRFTTADIARLESRLTSSGVYLQQCHVSLVLLSSRRVEEKLVKIESEYKQDKRAKSVLSAALVDGQDVDQEQMMDQAESDLMSEDVHPDAITLYRQGIKRWILAASNEADTGEPQQRPRISRASTSLAWRTQRHDSHQVPKSGSLSQTQTEQTGTGDSDETLGLAMAPFQLPPSDADGALSGLASIANSEAPSREASIKSHASKDSGWHPSSSEDPSFVTAMILKPFSVNPLKEDMPLARKIFYFTRAFNQIDYSEHGVRNRPDVISTCQDVMKVMTSEISPYHCDRFIYESDKNNDYMINKEEFLDSMIEASKAAHAILRDKALGRIRTDVQSANAAAVDRQLDSTGNDRRCIQSSLPWGFRYTETDDERVYDCVDQLWPDHQPQPLPLYSFTSLAQEVGTRGTGILNSSSSRWSAVLPKDRLREFNSTFDRVKSIAVRFDLLYRPGYTDGLSDLDEMLAVLNIIQSALPSEEIKEHLISLRQLQTKCESIGHLMRGFTFRLKALESENPRRPSPQTLKDDLTAWRQAHMDGWACFIADSRDFRALWTEIVEGITECRKWYAGFCVPSAQETITPHSQHERSKWYNTLQMQALDVARAYVGGIRNDNARRLIEHERQPQQIKIKRLCLIEEKYQTAPKRSLFSKPKKHPPSPQIKYAILTVFRTLQSASGFGRKTLSGPHVFYTSVHEDIVFSIPSDVKTFELVLTAEDDDGETVGYEHARTFPTQDDDPSSIVLRRIAKSKKTKDFERSVSHTFGTMRAELSITWIRRAEFKPEPEGPFVWTRLVETDSLLPKE